MVKLAASVAMALVAATLIAVTPAAKAAPKTIPAPRQWVAGGAGFTFGASTRVVAADPAVTGTARLLAAELRALAGRSVVVAGGPARPGDIELRLGAATGYVLTVGPAITVRGGTDEAVFHGTRTILQLLRQGATIPGGTATDWPAYPERGLMVDAGRKYFTVDWLKGRIRELAYLKLNVLHLHLSDSFGFRLESRSHPEIVSAQHYSKQEIRELIAYAARYHVQIVPELDFPGHMDAILAAHPDLRLVSENGTVAPGFIDLSRPAAYALMRDLITEYLPLFPGRYWHIGADEYVQNYADYPQLERYAKAHHGPEATGKDAYYGFVNWANAIVRTGGKTARMWNDGLKPGGATLTVSPDIVVDHWSAGGTAPWFGPAYAPQELVDAGHIIANNAFTPLYYTLGARGSLLTAPTAAMYDLWDPNSFVDRSRLTDPGASLGAKVLVWCDEPAARTEQQIAAGINHRLRVLAQQTWGSPKPAPLYLAFLGTISAVGAPPRPEEDP